MRFRRISYVWLSESSECSTALNRCRICVSRLGTGLKLSGGERVGQHSIRIHDRWRVCFVWKEGNAYDVEIVDYLLRKRGITADTALRLARYFRMSPQFWLGLQMDYELDVETDRVGDRLAREIEPCRKAV